MTQSETKQNSSSRSAVFDWAQLICAALVAIALIYTFVGRLVNVEGHSMQYTLASGERLILSGFPYTPERGDIVVISRGEQSEPLIKRVIGLPGDTIRIDEESGKVYRNGAVLKESYVVGKTATQGMTETVTVPKDMLFVMGDNRAPNGSWDSRSFGCVSQSDVVGKAVFRIMPFQRMGGLYDD